MALKSVPKVSVQITFPRLNVSFGLPHARLDMEGDKLFLTILRGSSPRDAQPVLATEDQEIIREVARALGRRLGLSRLKPTGGLELVHCHAEGDGDEE